MLALKPNLIALVFLSFLAAASAAAPPGYRQVLRSHCVKCHGEDGTLEGEVNLLPFLSDDSRHSAELLEKLVSVLHDRAMPPEGEPPLPLEARQSTLEQLRALLHKVQLSEPFKPIPIRRMNRFQFNNAVVDLLGLKRDIFQLNERILRRRQDYFHPTQRRMPDTVKISCRPLAKDIDGQRPEGFRGVSAFPQDQRAEHGFDNRADHLTLSPLLMEAFLQLSQSIVESPDLNPQECQNWDQLFAEPGQSERFPADGRYEAETGFVEVVNSPPGPAAPQEMQAFQGQWSGGRQLFWRCPRPESDLVVSFETDTAARGLKFGFTKAPDYGLFEIYLDDKLLRKVDLYDPRVLRAPDYEFDQTPTDIGVHQIRFKCVGKNAESRGHFFGLDYITVTGQERNSSPRQQETVEQVLRERLHKLLRRAFRRPVDAKTLDRFVAFASQELADGATVEDSMRTIVGAILAMPDFLYLYESPAVGEGTRPRIGDFELASRLAQFLWSSIPDDTLLDLAEAGRLSDPAVLGEQVDRMLNDRRSSRFCENFPAQWLQLDRLITSIPDPETYPYFYYNGYRSSLHMMSEPLLLFETVYIEDRSIVDLLAPDFTWQSKMLEANYEGHGNAPRDVQVQTFHRVKLTDARRGGMITNAAVMTMTSTPARTQPITRGAWINAVIFNDPPEPPPADVPPLPENDAEKLATLTIRERLAEHRKRADCAGCHNKIDPLGFALENFGPTGVWRDTYDNGRKVDPGGILFNQYEFKTLQEFKQLLVQEKQRFIRGFVSHLMSYSLGRELGPADSPALDQITNRAMQGQDQLRSLLKQVALSDSFLHKHSDVSVEGGEPKTE